MILILHDDKEIVKIIEIPNVNFYDYEDYDVTVLATEEDLINLTYTDELSIRKDARIENDNDKIYLN